MLSLFYLAVAYNTFVSGGTSLTCFFYIFFLCVIQFFFKTMTPGFNNHWKCITTRLTRSHLMQFVYILYPETIVMLLYYSVEKIVLVLLSIPLHDCYFFTAFWLSHGQFWAILKGTASLTRC